MRQSQCEREVQRGHGPASMSSWRPTMRRDERFRSAQSRDSDEGQRAIDLGFENPQAHSTPACPPAARPYRYGRPVGTARAPKAIALTTSPPRRMPLSRRPRQPLTRKKADGIMQEFAQYARRAATRA